MSGGSGHVATAASNTLRSCILAVYKLEKG